jgi:hypothetical protein
VTAAARNEKQNKRKKNDVFKTYRGACAHNGNETANVNAEIFIGPCVSERKRERERERETERERERERDGGYDGAQDSETDSGIEASAAAFAER